MEKVEQTAILEKESDAIEKVEAIDGKDVGEIDDNELLLDEEFINAGLLTEEYLKSRNPLFWKPLETNPDSQAFYFGKDLLVKMEVNQNAGEKFTEEEEKELEKRKEIALRMAKMLEGSISNDINNLLAGSLAGVLQEENQS